MFKITMVPALIFLLIASSPIADSFLPSITFQSSPTSSLLYTTDDHEVPPSGLKSDSLEVNAPPIGDIVPMILKIYTLEDLRYFLEEDNRLVAIKFYAPWCKKCQQLGNHFRRLGKKWGDKSFKQSVIQGRIRCAEVEFKNVEISGWVREELQIEAIPTLQLYSGLYKVWEDKGAKNTRLLEDELRRLEHLSVEDLQTYGESVDDGILQQAIEDSLYDMEFLNEEW